MKAPRQDASAAPSSERTGVDRAAAGDNREEAGIIQKTRYFTTAFARAPVTIYQNACHVYPRGTGHAREIVDFGEPLTDSCSSMVNGLERAVSSRSGEVKIALVLNKLRDSDVLQCDAVMGVSRDYRVPMPIVVCGCQESLHIRKYRVVDFDYICVGVEIRNGFVAEVSRKYESIAGTSADRRWRRGYRLRRRISLRGIGRRRLSAYCGIARNNSA